MLAELPGMRWEPVFRTHKESGIQSRAHLTAFPVTGDRIEPRPRQSAGEGESSESAAGRMLSGTDRTAAEGAWHLQWQFTQCSHSPACPTGWTACRIGVLWDWQQMLRGSSDSPNALWPVSGGSPDTCLLSGGLLLHHSRPCPCGCHPWPQTSPPDQDIYRVLLKAGFGTFQLTASLPNQPFILPATKITFPSLSNFLIVKSPLISPTHCLPLLEHKLVLYAID